MMPTKVLIEKYDRRSYLSIEINICKKVQTFKRKLSSILTLFYQNVCLTKSETQLRFS